MMIKRVGKRSGNAFKSDDLAYYRADPFQIMKYVIVGHEIGLRNLRRFCRVVCITSPASLLFLLYYIYYLYFIEITLQIYMILRNQ